MFNPENAGRQIPILIDAHIFSKWGVLNHQLEEMMVEKSPGKDRWQATPLPVVCPLVYHSPLFKKRATF